MKWRDSFPGLLALAGVAFGLFLFWFMALVDFNTIGDSLNLPHPLPFMSSSIAKSIFNLFSLPSEPGHRLSGMGPTGLLGFCLALGGFVALRRRKGMTTAVREGVTMFAAPMLVAFELGLWYLVPASMAAHATVFVRFWVVDGAYILSNAVVLLCALVLSAAGICRAICVRYYTSASERRYFVFMSTIVIALILVMTVPALDFLT